LSRAALLLINRMGPRLLISTFPVRAKTVPKAERITPVRNVFARGGKIMWRTDPRDNSTAPHKAPRRPRVIQFLNVQPLTTDFISSSLGIR
jgi:hypothetical protein